MSLILGRYPIEYRAEVIKPLMGLIRRGESTCVVGIAGVGKSNLVHFLEQPEVARHYLGEAEAARTHIVSLACLPGTQSKDELFTAMRMWAWDASKRLDPDTPPEAPPTQAPLQELRRVLRAVCQGSGQRFVFVLDEFECLLRYQMPGFLDDLRALRDDHRATHNLSFILITLRMPQLVKGAQPLRGTKFYGLVADHIIALPPYTEADALRTVKTVRAHSGATELEEDAARRLVHFSGGHAALLVALCHEPDAARQLTAPRIAGALERMPRARASCETIWNNLLPEEQKALHDLAQGRAVTAPMEGYLRRRGLVRGNPGAELFSPLFAEYVRRCQPPAV